LARGPKEAPEEGASELGWINAIPGDPELKELSGL
jgi:hypothetical protein